MRNRVRGKKKLSLKIDPPPDLAIEVVQSHDADAAIEVYRRFKVPEVWVYDATRAKNPGPSAERPISRSDPASLFPFSPANGVSRTGLQ